MTLTPEVQAIAERQAAQDRDLLASLVKSGRVKRSRSTASNSAFERDIERRVTALSRPAINATIIPKSKRRKKKR